MDVLVRWRDGTKNIVSSSELKITSRILKVGSKVKMLYKKKWYSGVVIDMKENVAAEWSSEDDVPLTNFSNVLKNSNTLQHNNIGFRKEFSFNDLKNNKDTMNQIGISSADVETMMEGEPIPEIEITDDFVVEVIDIFPLGFEDFIDFRKLSLDLRILKSRETDSIKWNDIMEVKVSKLHPDTLFFKSSHNQQEYSKITLKRQKKTIILRPLNEEPNKIGKAKYQDLMFLCHGVTPVVKIAEYRDFYASLPHTDN